MPNWIVHLAAGTALSSVIRSRSRILVLFLLGSILPDLSSIANVLFLDRFTHLFKSWDFPIWYFQPFHTPFLAVFYSLALALMVSGGWRRNFVNIYAGALTHFALDTFQRHIGFHHLMFYPFSMKDINVNLFFPDHWFFFVLGIVSVVLLLSLVLIDRKIFVSTGLKIEFRRSGWAALLVAAVICAPFLTKGLFYSSNYHWLQFFSGKDFEGRVVEIGNSRVVSLDPFRTVELNRTLTLRIPAGIFPKGVKVGDWVSYRGIWRNKTVEVTLFHKNSRYFEKIYLSLAGALFILWMVIVNFAGGGVHGLRQLRKK